MKAWPFSPLLPFCADLICIDPPWLFDLRSEKGEEKSAQSQYECMTDDQILALPVGDLVSTPAWIFLWVTAPKLPLGIECLTRWGFEYKTNIVWRKIYESGADAMGTGYIARSMHEICLIGATGRPDREKAIVSVVETMFDGVRREHSRKPEEFYRLIDEVFAPKHYRRVDIFARQSRPGWEAWGNESSKFDAVA